MKGLTDGQSKFGRRNRWNDRQTDGQTETDGEVVENTSKDSRQVFERWTL